MRCSRCQREIKKPAATIGKLTLGPTCARLMGLGPVPRLPGDGRVLYVAAMPGQLPLFEEVRT